MRQRKARKNLGETELGLVLFLRSLRAGLFVLSSAVAWATKGLTEVALLEALQVAVAGDAEEAVSECHCDSALRRQAPSATTSNESEAQGRMASM